MGPVKRAEVELYGQYAWSFSNRAGTVGLRRCVVLDLEPVWQNRYGRTWLNEYTVVHRKPFKTGRIAVAIEYPQTDWTETNPATGEPWTDAELAADPDRVHGFWKPPDDQDQDRSRYVEVARLWLPCAARMADLKRPWAEQAEMDAERERERAAAAIAHREQEAARKAAQAEAHRVSEERRRLRERKDAASKELFETWVAPVLIEYGIEHCITHQGDTVTMTPEALYRLIGRLAEGGEAVG